MRVSRGVFNTDQVNRSKMRFPASELMRAHQNHRRECQARGVRCGTPCNLQHDMHRLIGWSCELGLYLDSEMVRVLGQIEEPENETERAQLRSIAESYWTAFHHGAVPLQAEILKRAEIAESLGARSLQLEAAVVEKQGIAATLYPELFIPGVGKVDKDGLADYRDVIDRMTEIQPGIFHDTDRDLLLFAHRFFRRSLSHRNKLNVDFLQKFATIAATQPGLRVRLRLDPDIIGHPDSVRNIVELEYWRGPLYDDDIANIKNGVAEHKADERTRKFEGIDRTHVWWKSPETRDGDEERRSEFRTFEIEELIENPSAGLGDDQFGCRYAHAEFSAEEDAITHFDGAIRAYPADDYLKRIDASIDRAGKRSEYTKLFRLDNALPIKDWKEILTAYFRGNNLIPEYFRGSTDTDIATEQGSDQNIIKDIKSDSPDIAALVTLAEGTLSGPPIQFFLDQFFEMGGHEIYYLEVGVGQVAQRLRAMFDLSTVPTTGFRDGILNLPRIAFVPDGDLKTTFDGFVTVLADALSADVETGITQRAAVPVTWEDDGMLVTLAVAGKADKVAAVLERLPNLIDPRQPPSEWIEALSGTIKAIAPKQPSEVMWDGVSRGILEIKRFGEVEQQMQLPDDLIRKLRETGIISDDVSIGADGPA